MKKFVLLNSPIFEDSRKENEQYLSPLVRPLSMLPGRYLTITICG